MNKEIEKILATSGKYITYAERCYLLDYITNLHKKVKNLEYENTLLKTPNDANPYRHSKDAMLCGYKSKIDELEEENERLKENAIHNDKVVDKAKWNEMIYKSRNEKAMEYNKQIIKALLTCTSYEKDKVEDMLYEQQNILQGEDKDE